MAPRDGGKPAPHGIDVGNTGAAVQQLPRNSLLVDQAESGRRKGHDGRPAAGHEGDHEVVRTQARGKGENEAGDAFARRVRHRMTGLQHRNSARRNGVAVAGNDHAGQRHVGPRTVQYLRHQRGSLSCAHYDTAPGRFFRELFGLIPLIRSSPNQIKVFCFFFSKKKYFLPWPTSFRGANMTIPHLDDPTRVEMEAATFRRLVAHLRERTDVQNIDLMNLAGFCRNCLSRWYREAAAAEGIEIADLDAREIIYGMPYKDWQAAYQTQAGPEKQAAFAAAAGGAQD